MYIKVTAFPEFKKELIEKISEKDGILSLKIYLKQPAENGRANKRILEILSEMFPNKKIRIVNGHLISKKLIEVK